MAITAQLGPDTGRVVISRRVGWFLIGFGIWSWIIWPTFLKNIWADDRSWHHGMTTFFAVHLVLTVVSLVLGTMIGGLGIRIARAPRAAVPPIQPRPPVSTAPRVGQPGR